jgi:two-component system, cell cycle response regulator
MLRRRGAATNPAALGVNDETITVPAPVVAVAGNEVGGDPATMTGAVESEAIGASAAPTPPNGAESAEAWSRVAADVPMVTSRLLVLQVVRVPTALALPVITILAGDFDAVMVPLALAYGCVIGAAELARRRMPRYEPRIVSATVLVDGVALAIALSCTGGYRSPLLFLVFLQLVAVTVLVSFRSGLGLAAWCALLLLLVHALAAAGIVGSSPEVSDRFALVSASTFLLFASSAAVFSSVNERSLRRGSAQLARLVELGTDLEHGHRAEDAMTSLVRHVCGRLGFRRAVVLTRRDGRWWGVCDDGVTQSLIETHGHRPVPEFDALRSAGPLLAHSLGAGLLDDVLPDARNVVVTPVLADHERCGVVAAEWGGGDGEHIPSLTVQAMAQAALHTGSALQTAALLDEVERLATRDSLTGIANRRLFDESLARESARSRRLGSPLTLIVFDVDHFKHVNDRYGHMTGDAVLREVADTIVANSKRFDVAARYGGDEFVLLLPSCSKEDAPAATERVRTEISRRVQAVPVAVSAGVATMPDNALDGDRLVSAADDALNQAKRHGRDRAIASSRAATATSPAVVRLNGAPLARGA